MFQRITTFALAISIPLAGCGLFDLPTSRRHGPDAGSSGWSGIELAKSKAKPLERIPIEGVSDDVELPDLDATIRVGEGVDHLEGSIPGLVLPDDEGGFDLVAPFSLRSTPEK